MVDIWIEHEDNVGKLSIKSQCKPRFDFIIRYEKGDVFPWDPPEKRKEMFHKYSRFIIVTPDSAMTNNGNIANAEDILAYAIFRFERDEGRNVIYV